MPMKTAKKKEPKLKNDEMNDLLERVPKLEEEALTSARLIEILSKTVNDQKATLDYVVTQLQRQLLLPHGEIGSAPKTILMVPAPNVISKMGLLVRGIPMQPKENPRTIEKI